ncbi:protein toll-like [Contarinia nasturtii]|uniref:protein toll-like n=1 Tax=Contarinia nasturtii TaxID=265458 RepID=UPI0012D401C8|nr:protein toll-like [Contarinia nasturtii]
MFDLYRWKAFLLYLIMVFCFSVKCIELNCNYLNELHTSSRTHLLLDQLQHFDAIQFDNCDLRALPSGSFLKTSNLKKLSLEHNRLTKIPLTFFKHQVNLIELNLAHNELQTLHNDIFNENKRLVVLHLSYNRLSNISRSLISELEHLQFLYLDNNNLHTIHMTALDGTDLRLLHLQNNMLNFKNFGETWDVERASPFQTLDQLEELNMRNNSMTTFLHDWHTSNLALSKLDVSNNKIELLDFRFIFNNWTNPIRINVSRNNIKALNVHHDFTLIENESQVEWILNNNPLQCDCLLIHFATALRNQSLSLQKNRIKFITNHLKCSTPQQFAEKPLENIQLTEFTCSLPYTNCPNRCSCYVRPVNTAAVYNCSNANLTKIPDIQSVRHYLGLKLPLIELYIENNNITLLEMGNVTDKNYVNHIYAKNNFMENVNAENLPNNLMVLDLSGNKLKRISLEALDKLSHMNNLQNISFGENPWICDCIAYKTMKSIKNQFAKIMNVNDFICENDKELNMIDAKQLCPIDKTPILIILIILVALTSLCTTFFYMKQQEMMVWLFSKNATWFFGKQSNVDCNKEYDAFIWYATLDEKFVANDVMPQLENIGPKSLKICLLVREMQGGDIVPDQIAKCVEKSRQTIVILSPNSIEYFDKLKQRETKGQHSDIDVWGLMGFRVAHQNALNEKRSRVVIITKGDIGRIKHFQSEIRAYLTANINLHWGEERFFDKLRLAIAHPKYFKDKRHTNTIETI